MTEQEADSANDEADEVQPMKTITPNFSEKTETTKEHSGIVVPCLSKPTKQPNHMRVLWYNRPRRRRVSKEEA